MKIPRVVVLLLCFVSPLAAQKPFPDTLRVADFNIMPSGSGFKFTPKLPPTSQIAGAPDAYWTYLWEFGDGAKSTQASPTHIYTTPGEYNATLDVIAHYDTGKKPTRKKSKVTSANREALTSIDLEDVFDPKAQQAIAMATPANPRAGEELSFILSYRNKGPLMLNGTFHLFFNEKKCHTPHFKFLESRPCFGEVETPIYASVPPEEARLPWADWCFVGMVTAAQLQAAAMIGSSLPPSILLDARGRYREERAWKFENLEANAKRNYFFSLEAAATLIKDVNTMIHVEAVFVPDDPTLPAEPYTLELEIVASHDPNVIAVSDNHINYRTISNQKIDYKVLFQNNGEGPASTVVLQIEIPEGLDMKKIKPLDWQPKCPICPKMPTRLSCLDTLTTEKGYQFTFRNIYLPGSRQHGVERHDSTLGFVKYRIEANRDMPKYSFRSRAQIVFDRHPPIFTNYTHTRFKVGLSPGIKVGWNFEPDKPKQGFFLMGITLSPYKSWRIHPQIELLAGLKGQANLPAEQKTNLLIKGFPGAIFKDTIYLDTILQRQRGLVSFEVPILLRKNLSKHLGLGLGLSTRVSIENGRTNIKTKETTVHWTDSSVGFVQEIIPGKSTESVETYSNTRYDYSIFGDLTLGSVRAGPNLGIRAGAFMGRGGSPRPFIQLSAELKL
jgi:PKD repeat protein